MITPYSSRVMAAVHAMSERHFGGWERVAGASGIFALEPQTMGFVCGPALKVCLDTGEDVFFNAEVPDLMVTEDSARVEQALARWPGIRIMRLADFIDFVAPAVRPRRNDDARPSPALERLPSVAVDGDSKPIAEFCVARLIGGEVADRQAPMLILGGSRSGKTTLLDKIGHRAWEVAGIDPVRVCFSSRNRDFSKDALVRASIGARLQVADQHLKALAPFLKERTLILVDDAQGNCEDFVVAVDYAQGCGLHVIAAADRAADKRFPENWHRFHINCLSSRDVASLILEKVSREAARTYYPSLRLTRCVANVEDARDLRQALHERSEGEPDEAELASGILDKAIDRIAERVQPRLGPDENPAALIAGIEDAIGCHALECALHGTPALTRRESGFLTLGNVLRLVDHPRPASPLVGEVLVAASFLECSVGADNANDSYAWRSDLMRDAALARLIASQLSAEGVIDLRWPAEIPLPESQVGTLAGNRLTYPLLGVLRLDVETVTMTAKILARMMPAARRRAAEVLNQILGNCRGSAFYSIWPWRHAGGNALALLGHLQGGRLAGDYSGCRLSGASLSGLDLSEAVFHGALLDGAKLDKTKVRGDALRYCYLEGAALDETLRAELASDPHFPALGLKAGADHHVPWLSPPPDMMLETSVVGLAPFAVSAPVTKAAFHDFTERQPNFQKAAYIDLYQATRPEDFDRYYLWDWPEAVPLAAESDAPVVHIGRDAAMAYAAAQGGRLIARSEWHDWAPRARLAPGLAEWVWDGDGPGRSTHPGLTSLTAQATQGWLGLVGYCNDGRPSTGRVKSTNANGDVTFRTVFDFVQIVEKSV